MAGKESAGVALKQRSQARLIYAAGLVLTIGASTFNIMPLLTAGAVDTLGFTDGQAGVMSMAISLGSAVSAFFAVTWVRNASWRRVAVVALAGMAAADLAAVYFHGYWPLVLLQGAAGLFGTAVICLCLTILSDCPQAERGFGLSNAMQVVYQISAFLAGPLLVRFAGLNGLLGLLAVLGVLALALTPLLPDRGVAAPMKGTFRELLKPVTVLAVLGFGMFFLNAGAYWTYVQVMAEANGLSPRLAANCVALGISGGILGGTAAWWLGDRLGRFAPLLISCLMTLAAAILVLGHFGTIALIVSVLLYFFAWNYSVAYQLAIVSSVDRSGRGVALTQLFVFAGASGGAGLAAIFVSPGHYEAVVWLSCLGACASTALFAVALRMHSHEQARRGLFEALG